MPKKRYINAKKARKRKGFCGNRCVVNNVNNHDVNSQEDVNNSMDSVINVNTSLVGPHQDNQPSTSTPAQQPVASSSQSSSANIINPDNRHKIVPRKKLKNLLNISKEKLENSHFKKKYLGRTRQQSINAGINKAKGTIKAHSYKLVDTNLLTASLSAMMICKECRNPKSRFELLENPSKQRGLCETLIWQCSTCSATTTFETSSRCRSNINCFDVNLRSVYVSQPMGHNGLQKFCGTMNMCPPVTKNHYHKIQGKIHSKIECQTKDALNDSAERLFKITEEENPEDIDISEQGERYAKVSITVDGT